MNAREKGNVGEMLASSFLRKRGYRILCRNFRTRQGEIDIVAKDRERLVFVEVKMRNSVDFGYPAEAVTPAKIARMKKTAYYYLMKNSLNEIPYGFEVVSILKTAHDDYAIDLIPIDC